jgi:hypothetical protein
VILTDVSRARTRTRFDQRAWVDVGGVEPYAQLLRAHRVLVSRRPPSIKDIVAVAIRAGSALARGLARSYDLQPPPQWPFSPRVAVGQIAPSVLALVGELAGQPADRTATSPVACDL